MTYAPKPFVVTESGDTETAPDVAQPIALFGVEASGGGGVELPLGTDDIEVAGITGDLEEVNGHALNNWIESVASNLSGLADEIMAHNTQIEDLEGAVQDKPDLPISSYEVTAEQFDSSLYAVLDQLNTQLSTLQVEKADLPVNSDDVDLDGTTLTSALSDLASSFQDEMDDLKSELENYADAAAESVAWVRGEVSDHNNATEPGMYYTPALGQQNRPPGNLARFVIIVARNETQIVQTAISMQTTPVAWKRYYDGTSWSAWVEEGSGRSTGGGLSLYPGWSAIPDRQEPSLRREGATVTLTAAVTRDSTAMANIAIVGASFRPAARVDIVALYGDDMTPHLIWIEPDGAIYAPDEVPDGTRVLINASWPAAD